jgi:hypothetical protein
MLAFPILWVVRAVTNSSPADRGRKLLEKCVLFSSLDEKARRDIAAYARSRSFATGLKSAIHVGHSTGGGEVVSNASVVPGHVTAIVLGLARTGAVRTLGTKSRRGLADIFRAGRSISAAASKP